MQLPYGDNGALPPSPVLLALLRHGESICESDCLPHSNGLLPDLLHLADINQLTIHAEGLQEAWTWSGLGNQQITVNATDSDDLLPLVSGSQIHYQEGTHGRSVRKSCLNTLRQLDAYAVCSDTEASSPQQWEQLWNGEQVEMPPITGSVYADHFPIWNPLAIQRQGTVHIPLGSRQAPWALVDDEGRQYPVQVVEGPLGRDMLVSCDLGPLACKHLTAIDDPVSGAHWEANEHCLDNGRIRAEFNQQGLINRLCIDGQFQALSAPMPQPYHQGLPLLGKANVSVLEAGPVRSHIGVTIDCGTSILRIDYRMYVDEPMIHITTSWQGLDGEVHIELPTLFRSGYMRCGSSTDFRLDPTPHLGHHQAPWRIGMRWAVLGDPLGHDGIAVISADAIDVQGESGKLRLRHSSSISCTITTAEANLAHQAESISCPFLLSEHLPAQQPLFRLCDAPSLCAYWIRPHNDGFIIHVQETQGLRGRAQFFGLEQYTLWRCKDDGTLEEQLTQNKEGDAHLLNYGAHQVMCLFGKVL